MCVAAVWCLVLSCRKAVPLWWVRLIIILMGSQTDANSSNGKATVEHRGRKGRRRGVHVYNGVRVCVCYRGGCAGEGMLEDGSAQN